MTEDKAEYILVVEDEPVGESMKRILEELGYGVKLIPTIALLEAEVKLINSGKYKLTGAIIDSNLGGESNDGSDGIVVYGLLKAINADAPFISSSSTHPIPELVRIDKGTLSIDVLETLLRNLLRRD